MRISHPLTTGGAARKRRPFQRLLHMAHPVPFSRMGDHANVTGVRCFAARVRAVCS